jgi:hypothetical protein
MANYKQMDRVLDLASKTGDKVIVMSDNHDPYVIMTVKEYEALLHGSSTVSELSEDQLLDKINRDIAVWKASQDDLGDYELDQFKVDSLRKEDEKPQSDSVNIDEIKTEPIKIEEDDKYYIEPVD